MRPCLTTRNTAASRREIGTPRSCPPRPTGTNWGSGDNYRQHTLVKQPRPAHHAESPASCAPASPLEIWRRPAARLERGAPVRPGPPAGGAPCHHSKSESCHVTPPACRPPTEDPPPCADGHGRSLANRCARCQPPIRPPAGTVLAHHTNEVAQNRA